MCAAAVVFGGAPAGQNRLPGVTMLVALSGTLLGTPTAAPRMALTSAISELQDMLDTVPRNGPPAADFESSQPASSTPQAASSSAPTPPVRCDECHTVPGIEYIGRGYNLLYGNPVPYSSGHRAPVKREL